MAPTQHFRQKTRHTPEAESQRKANKHKKSLKDKIRGVQRLLRQVWNCSEHVHFVGTIRFDIEIFFWKCLQNRKTYQPQFVLLRSECLICYKKISEKVPRSKKIWKWRKSTKWWSSLVSSFFFVKFIFSKEKERKRRILMREKHNLNCYGIFV